MCVISRRKLGTIITESRERESERALPFGLDDIDFLKIRRLFLMAKNNEKKAALENFKMQAANEPATL